MQLTIVDQLAYSTVRIETELLDGRIGTGTGFFYALDRQEDRRIPVIITNKHVIKDARIGKFRLTLKDQNGNPDINNHSLFHIDNFEQRWKPHPDPEVDLCAMPIAPLVNAVREKDKEPFFKNFDKKSLPSKAEIDDWIGMEEVTMVGYPNGIWDEKNNFPVFRKGITASNPKYDWNGKKEFLIDMACFPGSSGSPVLLFNLGGYQTRKGTILGATRIKLLGILHSIFRYPVSGKIEIINVPIHQKPVAISSIPNNLGIIIKSERLLDFEGMFK